ncbi:GntR family transcriptional regulator [Nonomuraea longicatena]|uniref:HTH gntR-type domain-containing protein n=1 Tax=Nonomuraea longicatena TaxID=83682 RepID=A0ABN1PY68_9ACTN
MAEPQWKRIATDLESRIRSGEFPPGSYLPHRDQLRREYGGVATNTIAAAARALTEQLLVRRVANKGLLVLDPVPAIVDVPLNVLAPGGLWRWCCQRAGLVGDLVVTGVGREAATADVADLLDLRTGDEVVTRVRQATIDGDTVRLDWAYYPADLVKDSALARLAVTVAGTAAALADLGHAPAVVTHATVWTRPSTTSEAASLKLPRGAHVLAAERVVRDGQDRAVELVRFVANPQRIRIQVHELPFHPVAENPAPA